MHATITTYAMARLVATVCCSAARASGPHCSGNDHCFNITGAKNSDPRIPNGQDLNGRYVKTNR